MLKEIEVRTNYSGSLETFKSMKKLIEERYGPEIAEDYNPYSNCMSYKAWQKLGYKVNNNERGFKSVVIIEKKDKNGVVISKYPKTITLFYETQVTKMA